MMYIVQPEDDIDPAPVEGQDDLEREDEEIEDKE